MVQALGVITQNYVENHYRVHKFHDDAFLLTTDHGGWVLLTKEEYSLFVTHRSHETPELYSVLKERGLVLTKESLDTVAEYYRKRQSFLFHGPTLHIVIPTFRCNQACVYCHSAAKAEHVDGYDLDIPTAEKISEFILSTPTNSLTIEFQGGDCLLNYESIEHMINYVLDRKEDRNVRFSIVSNLTTIDYEGLDRLAQLLYKPDHGIISLNTSIDGPREIHDKSRFFRGGGGTYDEVVKMIRTIQTDFKYDFNLGALTTVTRPVIDAGTAVVDEYKKLGFNSIFIRPLNKLGFAHAVWKTFGYPVEDFIEYWKLCLDRIIALNREGTFMQEGWAKIVSSKILRDNAVPFVDLSNPCGAAIQQITYNHNGEIFTCDEAKVYPEFRIGSVDDGYEKVFRNQLVRSMIDVSSQFSLLCDSCAWRPYCGICPVLNYSMEGNVIPKLPENEKHILYYAMIKEMFRRILFSDDREILDSWQKNIAYF